MKRAVSIATLLVLILAAFVTPRVAKSKGKKGSGVKQEMVINNAPDNAQHDVIPPSQPKPSSGSALIVELDTSPSTAAVLDKMQGVTKQLVNAAPDGSQIGVVGIDSQALKRLFNSRAEAIQFTDSLTSGGGYTDLDRGVDGALALIQESGVERAAIAFLTDGRVVLPRRFRDRADFVQILKREFAVRPYIKVFVINVGGQPLKGIETLPPNVNIITLANWQDAAAEIEKSLAPQIKEQLAEARTQNPPGEVSPTPDPKTNDGRALPRALTIGVVVFGLGALVLWFARRRKRLAEPVLIEMPENAMRREDLEAPTSRQATPEPVALLEFGSLTNGNSNGLPNRYALKRGEKVSIGGLAFACAVHLQGLKQTQTVEIAFDGSTLNGVRLRPERAGVIDQVRLNRREAPIIFSLGQGDELQIGDYFMRAVFTDDESLHLVDTLSRTVSGNISSRRAIGPRGVHRGSSSA